MSFSYAPDLPTNTPGIWTVMDGFHPDIYGNYRTGWLAGSSIATPPTTGEARGYQLAHAYVTAAGSQQIVMAVRYTSGVATGRVIVYNGSTWNARTGTAEFCGFFAQLGNYTLAVGGTSLGINYRDATTTNNFAQATGHTSTVFRAVCVTAQNIAVAIGQASDVWATSDISDPTDFSTGEAASGNLSQCPGVGTAIVALGNDAIAFKDRGVFRGQYVGGTVKWKWTLIDTEKGCWGENCAVYGDGKVYFIGNAGAYSFDGNVFERIDYGVWRNIVANLALHDGVQSGAQHVKAIWDSVSRRLFLFRLGGQSVTGSGTRLATANAFFTYEPTSKKWGVQSRVTDAGTEAFTAICDGSVYNTYNASGAGPTYNTNILFFSSTNDAFKFLTSTFTAAGVTSYQPLIRTFRSGDRKVITQYNRGIPGWTTSDGIGTDLSTATLKTGTPYYSDSVNETETAGTAVTLTTDLYTADINQQGRRFTSVQYKINCEAALDGHELEAPDSGPVRGKR